MPEMEFNTVSEARFGRETYPKIGDCQLLPESDPRSFVLAETLSKTAESFAFVGT